jgi:hypothetical protein
MQKPKLVRPNALALASILGSGTLVAAGAAQAFDTELYGIVDVGLERYSGDGTGLIFPGMNSVAGNSDDKDFTLSNGLQSRIGLRGGERLNEHVELTYNARVRSGCACREFRVAATEAPLAPGLAGSPSAGTGAR